MLRKTLLVVVIALVAHTPVPAQEDRYRAWTGAAGDEGLDVLVAELRRLTREAAQARAADPRFLRDLEDLADRYDRPRPTELFHDDFRDGDLQRSPAWSLVRGNARADPGRGLVFDATTTPAPGPSGDGHTEGDPGAELALALLGSLLNPNRKDGDGVTADPSTTSPGSDTLVFTRVDIPNAFALRARLDLSADSGTVEFGVVQVSSEGPGYRLALVPGARGTVEVLRVGSRGAAVIERVDAAIAHGVALEWTRNDRGEMTVNLDGQAVLTTVDRGFKDRFVGLQIRHQGGPLALNHVTLLGTDR